MCSKLTINTPCCSILIVNFEQANFDWDSTIVNLQGIKDTHRKKSLPNKTQALIKSLCMDIWVLGTLNQLFIKGY